MKQMTANVSTKTKTAMIIPKGITQPGGPRSKKNKEIQKSMQGHEAKPKHENRGFLMQIASDFVMKSASNLRFHDII